MAQQTDAMTQRELAAKTTDQLVARYKSARREHADYHGHNSIDLILRASEEARNIEAVLESRGVSVEALRTHFSESDYSNLDW